jgi:Ca2+-binding EF-hand superfamily protein
VHADENQSSELSEIQVAELRKAFAICDQDGNGVIDASELRTVIRAILDEDPSDEEFQQVKTGGCRPDSVYLFSV